MKLVVSSDHMDYLTVELCVTVEELSSFASYTWVHDPLWVHYYEEGIGGSEYNTAKMVGGRLTIPRPPSTPLRHQTALSCKQLKSSQHSDGPSSSPHTVYRKWY